MASVARVPDETPPRRPKLVLDHGPGYGEMQRPEPETWAEGLLPGQLAPGQEPYVDPEPEDLYPERKFDVT